ncbi:MAG: hypothetical protein ABIU05_21985 [Nitrospirales bacterium]
MTRTLLSVKEVAKKLGVSVQSIRRAHWREEPRLSHQHNAGVRSGVSPANIFSERVSEDCAATRRAIGGASRRRAQQNRPRSVKRGRNFHGSLRRIS